MCFEHGIARRDFFLSAVAALFLPQVIAAGTAMTFDEEVITLPNHADSYTSGFVENTLDMIGRIAKRAGASVRFMFADVSGKARSLVLSFEKKDAESHPFPTVRKEDGSVLRITHAGDGPLHHVDFTGPGNDMLTRMKERLRHTWSFLKNKLQGEDVITLGAKGIAIGLGIWLGVVLAKIILAALSFFFFYAVVVVLVIAGAVLLGKLLEGRDGSMTGVKKLFTAKSARFHEFTEAVAS